MIGLKILVIGCREWLQHGVLFGILFGIVDRGAAQSPSLASTLGDGTGTNLGDGKGATLRDCTSTCASLRVGNVSCVTACGVPGSTLVRKGDAVGACVITILGSYCITRAGALGVMPISGVSCLGQLWRDWSS
jgi:hypothetical protein